MILDSSGEESDSDSMPFQDRKLPTYISLKLENPETQSMIELTNGTKEGTVALLSLNFQYDIAWMKNLMKSCRYKFCHQLFCT